MKGMPIFCDHKMDARIRNNQHGIHKASKSVTIKSSLQRVSQCGPTFDQNLLHSHTFIYIFFWGGGMVGDSKVVLHILYGPVHVSLLGLIGRKILHES